MPHRKEQKKIKISAFLHSADNGFSNIHRPNRNEGSENIVHATKHTRKIFLCNITSESGKDEMMEGESLKNKTS
jgi:hypothetical protein